MRALFAAALAMVIASAPAVAQATGKTPTKPHHARTKTESASARLRTAERDAIRLATRLDKKQDKTAERIKSDAEALGDQLEHADSALAEIERTGTATEKERVTDVRNHLTEARTHYDALVKAEPNEADVATHAAAVREHVTAAEAAMRGRAATHRKGSESKEKEKGSSEPKK